MIPLLLVALALQHPNANTSLAIVGADVLTMRAGDTLRRNQTVLVRGDRIAAIGDRQAIAVPAGSRVIDGHGKTLIPGLIDAHVHLEYFDQPDMLQIFLKYGVTTVRNMDGRAYILDWKRKIERGQLRGPAIYTAGALLDGDPPARDDNTIVRNADAARSIVMEQANAGYDFIKVYSRLSAETYGAIVAAAKERGLPVAGHVPNAVRFDDALAAQHSIEHLADYGDVVESASSPFRGRRHWSKLYLAFPLDSQLVIDAARKAASSRVWTVPTMVQADRALPTADSLQVWLSDPDMRVIPPDARDFWSNVARANIERMDSADWQLVAQGRANRRAILRALHNAGARVAAGTDTPNPFVIPGASLHQELVAFQESGFSTEAALAAATREAAALLQASPEIGTIETGKRADLVLLNGNPLENILNSRRIAGVVARGIWLAN